MSQSHAAGLRRRNIGVALELLCFPLIILSFLTYWFARVGYFLWWRRQPPAPQGWVFQDDDWLRPENIDRSILVGPRWNPHAQILVLQGLRVERTLEIDAAAADRSARVWTIVIYKVTGGEVAAMGTTTRSAGAVERVELAPGEYFLAGRYYDPTAAAVAPRVRIDDTGEIPACPMPAGAREIYGQVPRWQTLRHRVWQHHVYPMVRLRAVLPERLVRRLFLPVGNSQTTFLYGAGGRACRLHLETRPRLFEQVDAYFTVYNRASFPVQWFRLTEPTHVSRPLPDDGFWAVRLHARRAGIEFSASDVVVTERYGA